MGGANIVVNGMFTVVNESRSLGIKFHVTILKRKAVIRNFNVSGMDGSFIIPSPISTEIAIFPRF